MRNEPLKPGEPMKSSAELRLIQKGARELALSYMNTGQIVTSTAATCATIDYFIAWIFGDIHPSAVAFQRMVKMWKEIGQRVETAERAERQ